METKIISEINRIHEIMGLSILTEAQNPFLILLRNAARGLENEIGIVLGKTINSIDDITEKDIPLLLKSKNKTLRSLSTKAWGITQRQFNNKTYEELAQELAQRGLPKNQINRYIKNAAEDFGEPKGGLPQKPITRGLSSASQQIYQQGVDTLENVQIDLSRLAGTTDLSPEQKEFYTKLSEYLKRAKLPKVSEKDIDLLVDNTKALLSKTTNKEGDNFERLFPKLENLTRKIGMMTSSEQKKFLTQLIREINNNPSLSQTLSRYIIPFKDPRWSTDFMKTWKDSIKITQWLLLSSTAMDIIRGTWDYFKDRDFQGHFGMEFPASFAAKLAASMVPYINLLASLAFFTESTIRTIKGDKPTQEPENKGGTLDDLMKN